MRLEAKEARDMMHRHVLALHRHPNWHGHCPMFFGQIGRHTCRRFHMHFWYKHDHEPEPDDGSRLLTRVAVCIALTALIILGGIIYVAVTA